MTPAHDLPIPDDLLVEEDLDGVRVQLPDRTQPFFADTFQAVLALVALLVVGAVGGIAIMMALAPWWLVALVPLIATMALIPTMLMAGRAFWRPTSLQWTARRLRLERGRRVLIDAPLDEVDLTLNPDGVHLWHGDTHVVLARQEPEELRIWLVEALRGVIRRRKRERARAGTSAPKALRDLLDQSGSSRSRPVTPCRPDEPRGDDGVPGIRWPQQQRSLTDEDTPGPAAGHNESERESRGCDSHPRFDQPDT